jgi:hypothetical protein
MKSLALITKLLSVSVIVYLVPQVVDVWESRNQSLRVGTAKLATVTRDLEPLYFPRKDLSESDVDSIASKNLFRKHRSQYIRPVRVARPVKKMVILEKATPIIKVPVKEVIKPKPKHIAPSPKLTLEGVVIIPGRNIAILNGQYPLPNSHKGRLKFHPLKTNRFVLGDMIGGYQITEIQRDQVILSNLDGEILKLTLEK